MLAQRLRRRVGFSLIELLVVMVIIAIIVALLMVSVQAIREAANRVTCANNLRNIGHAWYNYNTVHGHLPSGGWGWGYVGDPDRPPGKAQGGGWVFAILPYIEQENLYNMGKGMPAGQKGPEIAKRVQTPIKLMNCPTRRTGGPWTHSWGAQYAEVLPTRLQQDARGDYAACCGSQNRDEIFWGPGSYAAGDASGFSDQAVSLNGVCYQCSEIRFSDVTRGYSNVCMVGERYIDANHYYGGDVGSDNECMYTGFDNDNYRCTASQPLQDRKGYNNSMIYGSAHRTSFNMLYVDGGVRRVRYDIDPARWQISGARE